MFNLISHLLRMSRVQITKRSTDEEKKADLPTLKNGGLKFLDKFWTNDNQFKLDLTKQYRDYLAHHDAIRLYAAALLTGWFYLFPSLISNLFGLFTCKNLSGQQVSAFDGWSTLSTSYLIHDLDIGCTSAQHLSQYACFCDCRFSFFFTV
jgi:hypothetical protein